MFFFLSKILYIFAMPISWLFGLLIWARFTKSVKRQKQLYSLLLLLLCLLSNPFLINELFLYWEIPPTPFSQLQNHDVGIVLTGFSQEGKQPTDRVYLNQAADRVVHTIKLYKEKKIKYILICGAEHNLQAGIDEPYQSARDIFLSAAIPDSVIFAEPHSRNTRENAVLGKQFLDSKFPNQSYLLITSAFHIRRARACFEKVGLPLDTFSVDFVARNRTFAPVHFIPREDSLGHWGRFVHEIVGYVVYKIMGYA
jgi:uncharacterized SAM-binding protein YcdF (DUF218 family)